MNIQALKALLQDAVYQILDNWVFRILTILGGMLVLATFLVGFREDDIVLVFGLKSWSYASVFAAFGTNAATLPDPQGVLINTVLDLLFNTLAGSVGLIFCIAATAFFVPQMIEKGAADVLFHKPLSRLTFYLARYFTGLLFVAALSTLMAGGVYLGLLVSSGYHDPGVLLAAPVLTYLFGLIFALSMWIGVVTRSTVASILLTALFFSFNGCVHYVWEKTQEGQLRRLDGLTDADVAETSEKKRPTDGPLLTLLKNTNAALHYALPKTGDADVLASKLRRAVNRPYFVEDGTLVALFRLPDDLERVDAAPTTETSADPAVLALLGDVRLALRTRDAGASYTLFRRPSSKESATRAGKALRDALLEDTAIEDVDRDLASFGLPLNGQSVSASVLRWERVDGGRVLPRMAVLFRGAEAKALYTLWIEDDVGVASSELARARLDELLARVENRMGLDPSGTSYERHFTLTAPWRFNILFSVGSSLAFVAVMLLLGWWKLARIEF